MNLYINQLQKKADFKEAIYAGDIFLNTELTSAKELCAFAQESITAAFDGETDHHALHRMMPVEDFVALVTRLKGQFTNSQRAKDLIRAFTLEIGVDPQDYIFDVPRVRVVPNYNYLHAGVSYAYKPHRDTWYGSVDCQINTWMPVHTIKPEQTMMINPAYFDVPVKNTSADWSLSEWINTQRHRAKDNLTEERRVHPVPQEEINGASEVRIAGNTGEMLIFSGSHLHGTVPNYTDNTRFSVDFRLMHLDDLKHKRGAINVDSACPDVGAGFKDYFHAHDFSNFQGIK
ncbi:helicase associated domain-containing protein [Pseudomonas sp. 6D_7.1_Bac1]|uniref:helicase associated domain-containing protein n=1 Tax=Pseudomonas sp. 6D_7.1_Bac1 TaxID=2971615 RepID=UPI0021C57F69|nr:helicase associated domain-containing protein [Pseudomonas sp. 6D_7.1_Bac1]MCU1748348.1 helicase associated domain-containing protein [Pseudomonas sp. 6D_7.1_Bac1]